MESPIPILPLPTPDAETEKLIRMKDEEVGEAWSRGGAGRKGLRLGMEPGPSHLISYPTFRGSCPTSQLRRMQEMLQKMKQQMQDQ